jgi:FO synthase
MADTDIEDFYRERPTAQQALGLLAVDDWRRLAPIAGRLRDAGWGLQVSYSRKVFVPLTRWCRDVCHYCTFAQTPRTRDRAFLTPDEVLNIARQGATAGCKEVLFTLGDKPEARYAKAREALAALGHGSTLGYLEDVARQVIEATGLLPHLNPGLMEGSDLLRLRRVAPSMGIMLETAADRLSQPGGPHFGSPDKVPARRLETIRLAGQHRVPLTTGILIGIGETRRERIEALLALRQLNDQYGHIQEIIVQNFRAKPGTKMRQAPEPSMQDLCWTLAVARLLFGSEVSIQAPPNLFVGDLAMLIEAGINDWGGISPVTPDYVNPEAPWPQLADLARQTERAGHILVERLTVYPRYVAARGQWIDPALHRHVLRLSDGAGLARPGRWTTGALQPAAPDDEHDVLARPDLPVSAGLAALIDRAFVGHELNEAEVASMFSARAGDFTFICAAADRLRTSSVGDTVTYVVTRNINYTNICLHHCAFCAFSKGKAHEALRGEPYMVELPEIARRVGEAWDRGATEVCMQGGIHPSFTGQTYLEICRVAKQAVPAIHVHAFSPLEVSHGATTLGLSTKEFLAELKAVGLGSLPGTAAEILDDEIRREICPDKIDTETWLRIVGEAHEIGLPTTSTIMFGHLEDYVHWARHLLRLRALQHRTRGFTELVPLPFVHMEAPLYLKGRARKGPTLREAILMHAVARLVLHPLIRNIQVSWVKLGPRWAQRCLASGANDFGGTLMNESISRAAGASHGQELAPPRMEELIKAAGRHPQQRTTLYAAVAADRRLRAFDAAALQPPVTTRVTGRNVDLMFRHRPADKPAQFTAHDRAR